MAAKKPIIGIALQIDATTAITTGKTLGQMIAEMRFGDDGIIRSPYSDYVNGSWALDADSAVWSIFPSKVHAPAAQIPMLKILNAGESIVWIPIGEDLLGEDRTVLTDAFAFAPDGPEQAERLIRMGFARAHTPEPAQAPAEPETPLPLTIHTPPGWTEKHMRKLIAANPQWMEDGAGVLTMPPLPESTEERGRITVDLHELSRILDIYSSGAQSGVHGVKARLEELLNRG